MKQVSSPFYLSKSFPSKSSPCTSNNSNSPQALVQARLSKKYHTLREATYGIAFFATPHQGGNYAQLGDIIAKLAKGILGTPSNTFMESLKEDGLYSKELVGNLRDELDDLYILSFYETLQFKEFGLVSTTTK